MKKLSVTLSLIAAAIFFMAANLPLDEGYAIGDKVDDFKLKGINDEWSVLSESMGEDGAIIIFTCNTCPFAKMYEDRIIELHNMYADQGFPVIAINPNDPDVQPGDSFEKMKERAGSKGFTFQYLFDDGQEVYPKFAATNTPQVFLIDSEMKLRYKGAIDDNPQDADAVNTNYVSEAIAALKEGEDPETTTTKAIGCGIKAKKNG